MSKTDPKQKLEIATRKAKPKPPMFGNLRTREQVETVDFEDLVAPATAPAPPAPGAPNVSTPPHRAPGASNAPPAPYAPVAGYTRVSNEMLDRILPTLDPFEQSILVRLYRLSRGFNSDVCRVSVPKLASTCKMGERKAQHCLAQLEKREIIKRVEQDFSNRNVNLRGVTFRVLIADPSPARHAPPALYAPGVQDAPAAPDAPNKVNTQKENTQTPVSVGSKFSPEECRRYAQHLQATGQGINNPGGYATTIHRTGEADALIEAYLSPDEPVGDFSACPDCAGVGWVRPEGTDKGVKRCRHERLK